MTTDDERREAAERLRDVARAKYPLGEIGFTEAMHRALGGDDWRDMTERLADLIEPEKITGDTSDGYHTFDELYDHRAKLFSVIVRDHRELAWKSRFHHDGTMYDGMFIVGIETPDGQATYHYDVDPYWDIFDCRELDRAPEWDGHSPQQAIERIAALGPSCDREALLALVDEMDRDGRMQRERQKAGERWFIDGLDVRDYARRIREACGEVAS